jgi:hypothetical protein
MFVAEFPSTGNRRKHIRSFAFSRNGGAYVILPANPFLLKYNKNGIIIDRFVVLLFLKDKNLEFLRSA